MTRERVRGPAPPAEDDPFDAALQAADDEPRPARPYQGGPGAPVHGVRQITVTWGEEVIQPIQYNGFRVGPLSMTVDVLPHETPREAYARVWKLLDDIGQEQFAQKLAGFMQRAKASGQAVRSRAGT